MAQGWLPGRIYVKEALEQRFEVDPSGQIMRLNNFCPWKEHLYTLEEEMNVEKPILFCLYEDDREKKWRIQVRAWENRYLSTRLATDERSLASIFLVYLCARMRSASFLPRSMHSVRPATH